MQKVDGLFAIFLPSVITYILGAQHSGQLTPNHKSAKYEKEKQLK